MKIVQDGVPFSFNYVAPDQVNSLKLAGLVYDVTSGAAVLEETVAMVSVGAGAYSGTFTGAAGRTYMVICGVFTDDGLTIPDLTRAAVTDFFQCSQTGVTFFAFDYTTYDQDADLSVQAQVIDVTGAPDLVDTVNLVHVALGAYFGKYLGEVNKTYQVRSAVYTDGTYNALDPDRAAACESFQGIDFNTVVVENTFGEISVDAGDQEVSLEAEC